jgi:hypothetical protein
MGEVISMVTIIVNPLDITGAPFTWHSGEQWNVAYSFKYLAAAGDTVKVYLDIKYSTGLSVTLHVASETLTLAESDDPANPLTKTSTLLVTVPSTDFTADPGTYDLILNVGGQSISEPKAINLEAGTGNFTLIQTYKSTDYSSYVGYVDEGTYAFTLGPNEIPFLDTSLAKDFVDKIISGAKAKGSDLLSYKLYRDTSAAFTTPYQIDIAFKSPNQTATTATSLALGIQPLLFGLDDAAAVSLITAALVFIGFLILIGFIVAVVISISHSAFGKAIGGAFDLLGSLIPLIIVMVIMKMMMESQQPEGTKKPVTEAVVKGGKAIGRGVVAVGKAAAPIIGGAIGTLVGGPVGGVVGGAAGGVAGAVGGAVVDAGINAVPTVKSTNIVQPKVNPENKPSQSSMFPRRGASLGEEL